MGVKHIPIRTCIACREQKPKFELIRIVKTPEGVIDIDLRGKRSGRGAYLCPKRGCWEKGLKKDRLNYALRGGVSEEDIKRLKELFSSLPLEG